ncbi:hypothetical protein BGW37DRAFT_480301 [Umbelopsis sp. PMI_123]|nr:hypothetical protein BGW37DRAFT_480301 [Umbelopsis sp. PMI_123]
MTALSRTWASPLSSPQIEPLQNYNNASRSKSPDDASFLNSRSQSPSSRIESLQSVRASSEQAKDEHNKPQDALFHLLQRQKERAQTMESDDDSESRRRSSVFGLGLFRGLPDEERQEQLKAEADFAFECPVCGNEDVQFWSRGRTAGQAECQSRTCGHRWMWKPTTKMVREGTTFEPNMPLPPKQSSAPAPKRRKLKENVSDVPPPSYSQGMYDRRDHYSSYYTKAPRRIPPEVSFENPMNPYGNASNMTPDYRPNQDPEFIENYERFFANREPDMDPSSGQQLPFSSTKYPEPVKKANPQVPADDIPIDEEDEIYQSELLELELRKREIEARREAYRARKSQLLLQQRREQLREQNLQRQRQSLNLAANSDDNRLSPANPLPSNPQAKENEESITPTMVVTSTKQVKLTNNVDQDTSPKSQNIQEIPRHIDNGSTSDGYMFSDEEEAIPTLRNGNQAMKERKTVKPVVQVEEAPITDEEVTIPRFAQDATMSDEDRMINEAYGYYFSDEEEDTALVATGVGIRKQPVLQKVSDTEAIEDDENVLPSESESIRQDVEQVALDSEQRRKGMSKPAPKKRGRKPNPNKKPKPPRDPNEPPKKRGRKPNPNKKVTNTKKPMNSFNPYLLFNRDMRKKLAEEHKGKSNGEISRMISEAWKNITPEEKQKYLNETNEKRKQLGLRACEPRDKNEQRGVPNPFVLFNVEQRPKYYQEYPGLSLVEMNGLVTERWKALTESEKQVYYDRFDQYKKELLETNPGFRRKRRLGKSKQEQPAE